MKSALLRKHSPRRMRWILALYPPMLLNRVKVEHISEDFGSCRMRIRRSLLTRNINGTTFGGTISSAADPVHAILLWQTLAHRDLLTTAWTRGVRTEFLAPATTDLQLHFRVSAEEQAAAVEAVRTSGKYTGSFRTEALDAAGRTCASIETSVTLKRVEAAGKKH